MIMNNLDLVSIVTPAYNASKTIEKVFESIVNQTYGNWEWIIVNDCSTDETYGVLKKLSSKDSRIVICSLDKNSGAASARNTGIDKARGRYIAFIDSDDAWEKDKLEKQISFMKQNNYDFTCTNYYVLIEGKKEKPYINKYKRIDYKRLLKSNIIGCSTVIIDVQNIGKQYMPLDAIKREDHAAWLDILNKGVIAYRLEDCLTKYYISKKGSVSSNKARMFKYQYLMYRNHMKFSALKSFYFTVIVGIHKIFKY